MRVLSGIAAILAGAGAVIATGAACAADLPTKAPAMTAEASGPAVDGVNGKIDGFGGSLNNKSFYGSSGALSIPLGYRFGAQIDGLAGGYDGDFLGGVGGHLFWRDPAKALVGLYAGYTYLDRLGGARFGHFGAEGAWYAGRWTVGGVAGVESGNSPSATVGGVIETIDGRTRFFDIGDVSYYAQDNLKFSIGHRYLGGKNALALGTEWGMPIRTGTMAALFAEGRVGEHNNNGIWGGVKLYFGQKDKSLIRRHREDDPPINLSDTAASFGNAGGTTAAAQHCTNGSPGPFPLCPL